MADPGQGTTLVTVLHNSGTVVGRLLASVSRQLPGAEVVAVDSGSDDGGAALVRDWPGESRVIDAGANVGFGRASNLGVEQARGDVTVLVNPDVALVDASLAALADEARSRPNAIFAPAVQLPGGARQDNAHHHPLSWWALLSALVPPPALPAALAAKVAPWRSDRPQPAAWAVGCCLAAATATLRDLGPFDARIFMYAEDMELGLRARARGIETVFWPGARVHHDRAHSTDRAFGGEPIDLIARQRHAVAAERLGKRGVAIDDLLQAITFVDRAAIKALVGHPTQRERRQLAAVRAARRARAGLG